MRVILRKGHASAESDLATIRQALRAHRSLGPRRLPTVPDATPDEVARLLSDCAAAEGFLPMVVDPSVGARSIAGWGLLSGDLSNPGVEVVASWRLSGATRKWIEAALLRSVLEKTTQAPVFVVTGSEGLDPISWSVLSSAMARQPAHAVVWMYRSETTGLPDSPLPEVSSEHPESVRFDDAALVGLLIAISPVALLPKDIVALSGLDIVQINQALEVLRERGDVFLYGARSLVVDSNRTGRLRKEVSNALQSGLLQATLTVLRARGVPATLLVQPGDLPPAQDHVAHDTEARQRLISAMLELVDISTPDAARFGLAASEMFASDRDPELLDLTQQLLPLLHRVERRQDIRLLVTRVLRGRGSGELEALARLWEARADKSTSRALQTVDDALRIPDLSASLREELVALRLSLLTVAGRSASSAAELQSAIRETLDGGNAAALASIHVTLSQREFAAGMYGDARASARDAMDAFRRSELREADWTPQIIWEPRLLNHLGETPASADLCSRMMDSTSVTGHVALRAPLLALSAAISLSEADLERAGADSRASIELAADASLDSLTALDPSQSWPLGVFLRAALLRGDGDDTRLASRLIENAPSDQGEEMLLMDDVRRLFVAEVLDSPGAVTRSAAVGRLRASLTAGDLYPPWADPSDLIALTHLCLDNGWSDLLASTVRATVQRAAQNPLERVATSLASHVHGIAMREPTGLEHAANEWHLAGRRLLAADAHLTLASLLADHDKKRALEFAGAAHATFASSGATREAAKARRISRQLGRVLTPPASVTPQRLAPLTASEAQVVERAVQGETVSQIADGLFISTHTVAAHLRHVYIKLGVNSRAELSTWHAAAVKRERQIRGQSSPEAWR